MSRRRLGRLCRRITAKMSALALPLVLPLVLLPAALATTARPAHADEPPGRDAAPTAKAPIDAIVAQSRCSDPPEGAEFLSRKYAGQLKKGPDGALRISVWDLSRRTAGAGRIAVEGEVIRAVLETKTGSPGATANDPAARCDSGGFRETYAVLAGPAAGRPYRLQVDELALRRVLAEGIEAEVGHAWDCGGPIAEAESRARSENRALATSWVDARTLRIVVHANHTGGRQLQPEIELWGNHLRAGYRDIIPPGVNGPIPACLFSNRFTYVVSGATPDMTVSLSTEREWWWTEWILYAWFPAALVAGIALILRRRIRRRQAQAAAPHRAP